MKVQIQVLSIRLGLWLLRSIHWVQCQTGHHFWVEHRLRDFTQYTAMRDCVRCWRREVRQTKWQKWVQVEWTPQDLGWHELDRHAEATTVPGDEQWEVFDAYGIPMTARPSDWRQDED